jgi:uncharacterized protein involved in propanediol utilization
MGAVAAGHFGELLQGRLGPDGPVALATLACDRFPARAWFAPRRGARLVVIAPGGGRVAAAAARAARAAARARGWGGVLRVRCAAPVGAGMGSSTLGALAALRAVAAAFGSNPDEAALCLEAEGASDPLMLTAPGGALWASREGRALALAPPPPRFWVAGGLDGPPFATDARDDRFADVADLARDWREACARADAAALGRIASESALRNQPRAPKPRLAAALALARERDGLGVVAAHTGPALGLMFLDRAAAVDAAPALAAAGVARVAVFAAGGA